MAHESESASYSFYTSLSSPGFNTGASLAHFGLSSPSHSFWCRSNLQSVLVEIFKQDPFFILYPPQPSSDLALAFLTLERLIMLPHVRVVLPFLGKLQITDVAFPECEFVNNQVWIFHLYASCLKLWISMKCIPSLLSLSYMLSSLGLNLQFSPKQTT